MYKKGNKFICNK